MTAPKRTYTIEARASDGRWLRIAEPMSLDYARGWLDARLTGPTPRLAYRLVDSRGKVLEELQAVDEVRIGQVAGSPSAEQLEAAAARALERARQLREVEAERERRRAARRWRSGS